jgi:8-oxo-dGTP diphosphatase
MTPTHAGLTADVFVVRGDTFLALERGPGLGEGVWYLPGGLVDRGEDPAAAAVRETREETGLDLTDVRILRVWTYATPEGHETVHATFVASAPAGEVVLSAEHTAFGWVAPADYMARWCSEELEAAAPEFAGWIRQVRLNCQLVDASLRGGPTRADLPG